MKAFVLHNKTRYPAAAWFARRACWPPVFWGNAVIAEYYSEAVKDGIVFA